MSDVVARSGGYSPSEAPGLVLQEGVRLGADVTFGANVFVAAGTVIGDGCTVEHNVVLGKQPQLAISSTAARSGDGLPALQLGAGVKVCSGATVFAGTQVGPGTVIGDQAHVRERVLIGPNTVIGRGSGVENDVQIGAGVRIQSSVYLTAYSAVEDEVFLGPCVVTTNDDTMGRHPRGERLVGAVFRRACRIGGGAVVVPGVEIGPEAFVAAGAVVTRNVPEMTAVRGVPARVVGEVTAVDLIANWR